MFCLHANVHYYIHLFMLHAIVNWEDDLTRLSRFQTVYRQKIECESKTVTFPNSVNLHK